MPHPEFAPVAFIAASSLFLPLPWHWRAGNVATLSIIAWLFVSNVIYGVDAIIWSGNADIVAPLWCDITTKVIIGAVFALPAACLCICIHLEHVASSRVAKLTFSDKRRRQIFEAVMCIGLPMVFMALHYIVQGHRFDIIEDYGCRPTTYFSIPGIIIVYAFPLFMAGGAIIFAGLALRHFVIRRITFAAHLTASQSSLTTSRYLRLMAMAVVQMVWSITATSYELWFTVKAVPIRPWNTWAKVHSNFSGVGQFYTILTPPAILSAYNVLWWMVPSSTFLFVVFFSFGQDAVEEYKKLFMWFRTRVLRQNLDVKRSKKNFIPMPSFINSIRLSSKTKPAESSTESASSLPMYQVHTPSSPSKFSTICDHESVSRVSHCDSTIKGKAYEFTLNLPKAASQTPLTPPSPLTPPPINPRLRALILGTPLSSSRPMTYPSDDASHRYITPSNL